MILMRIAMTFYEVPRGALAPELTKDYDQRNIISGSWYGLRLGRWCRNFIYPYGILFGR